MDGASIIINTLKKSVNHYGGSILSLISAYVFSMNECINDSI